MQISKPSPGFKASFARYMFCCKLILADVTKALNELIKGLGLEQT